VLSEALDLLEHRAAVHNTRVASLERELQEKNELERANERLLKEKQKHMASFSVRLDSCLFVCWLVGWLVGVVAVIVVVGFLLVVFCLLFSLFFLPSF
jgi:Flp pilus assembly protein TadB